MTQGKLTGLRIAILATDGFEQSELTEPRKALDDAGATTEVVSPKDDEVRGWNHQEWGHPGAGRPGPRRGRRARL